MDKIIEQLKELEDLFRQEKKLPNIEKDLILEKLRNLYELILTGNKTEPASTIEKASPVVTKVEVNPLPAPVEISAMEAEEKIDEFETENNEIESEEIGSEEERVSGKKDNILSGPGIDLFSSAESKTNTEHKETIVDKISKGKNKETVADIFQKNKISSLRDAIGINDKFFFINELFSGELKLYNQSVERLDSASSANEGEKILVELKDTYHWKEETEAWIKLQEFVQKKFTS